ncbi:MAG TPA: permease-like cell division protein FtsX [Longimicrobiaceae bacterium]|nr:permease-like cell division protein FtsX [Longimicrobiaceae bacterium]
MSYSVREAIAAFRRTPLLTVLSIVAICFGLFVVGLFALTAHNIRLTIEKVEERVEVVAYLEDGATEEQVQQAQSEIRAIPEVMDVRYVSKMEALATAVQELEEFRSVFADLEGNPLPASLEVRLRAGSRTPAVVRQLAEHLSGYAFVEDVRFGGDWLDRIVMLRQVAAGAAAVIGGAFALVAAVIIATAVRIAVFARREEISIMRLVGATDGFIQRPFLIEGLITGLLGGAAAVALTFAAFELLNASLIRISWLPLPWVIAAVAIGGGFGLVASALSVRRHLRIV